MYRADPVAVLALLIGACAEAPPPAAPLPPPPAARGPNLVLVTLDTTRADRIGAYGYAGGTTPTIDALAAGGVRFARAYAAVPLTTPSHASMLTGLYPTRHGIHTNGDAVLGDDLTTLAEMLGSSGWRTAASVSAFVTQKVWNLDQGFDVYFDDLRGQKGPRARWGTERPADAVVDDLAAWLDTGDGTKPFFVWAHFYDPHHPHAAPPEFEARFPESPYDAELAFVDAQVGRLRQAVEAAAGGRGTAWIVVADHGEGFDGEHGESGHGLYLFDSTTRVPFVLVPPAPLAAPLVVSDRAVSGVDVMPTALGLCGLSPPAGIDGADLSPLLRGETVARDGAYLESRTVSERFGYHPEIAYVRGPLKLMDTPSPRLFDLGADPGETTDLFASRPAEVAALRAELGAVLGRAVEARGGAPAPEVHEQLAALGYIAGDQGEGAEASTVDAKDRRDTILELERTRPLLAAGEKGAEAEAAYRRIAAREPGLVEARSGLARALLQQEKNDEAIGVYEEALRSSPSSTVLRMNYAAALALTSRHEDALEQVDRVLEQVPGDEQARVVKLRTLADLGRVPEAIELARSWLESEAGSWALHAQLGVMLGRQGDLGGAVRHLELSLSDGIPRPMVYRTLALADRARGDDRAAAEHLRRELSAFSGDHEARMMLGSILMDASRWEEASAEFRYVAEAAPEDRAARRLWAQGVFNLGDYALAAQVLAPLVEGGEPDAETLLLHANILDKQGDEAGAREVFEQAKAEREAELAGGR